MASCVSRRTAATGVEHADAHLRGCVEPRHHREALSRQQRSHLFLQPRRVVSWSCAAKDIYRRSYELYTSGDASTVTRFVSRNPGTVILGTDATEWFEGETQ